MARGLHHTRSPNDITHWLEMKGFKIKEAINIMKHERDAENNIRINKPLPLFMLVFDASEDIKRMYEMKNIMEMNVKIEARRKKNFCIMQELSVIWTYKTILWKRSEMRKVCWKTSNE